jgi:hypothetical protein
MTLDLWLKLISTFFTAVLGVAASILAYQQYRLNKNLASEQLRLSDSKLRFDLYEKRLALFMILRDFASQVAITNEEIDTGKFYRDTIERYFLFDAGEHAYFDEVYQKAGELKDVQLSLLRPNLTEEEEQTFKAKSHELRVWFFNQSDEMINVFSNCLSIRTLKQPKSLDTNISYPQPPN